MTGGPGGLGGRLPVAAPTARGLALLLGTLLPVAVAIRFPLLLLPGLALVAVAYAAIVVDRFRAPGPAGLAASRRHPTTFPVGRATTVEVDVEVEPGAGRMPLSALVRDEHPVDVPASLEVHHVDLVPGVATTVRYTLTPRSRGQRRFGAIVVRVPGPLGLATRQTSVATPEDSVIVDPDLSAVGAYDALQRRGQLAELGVRALRRAGEGTEFERIRDAVPDDPLRAINWRATARTGRLMARELIPERAQPVVICIDTGRLMGVGAGSLTKLDHALAAALLLAHVALRTGDRVGLCAFSARIDASVAVRPGGAHLGPLLEAVRPLRPADVDADFEVLAEHLQRTQRRRALVAIFTDVIDQDQGRSLLAACNLLRRRHLPLVITVRDPAVDEAAGRRPATSDQAYARAVASGMLADRSAVLRTLRRSGVDTLDADARSVSPRLVNRYLELKRRARL